MAYFEIWPEFPAFLVVCFPTHPAASRAEATRPEGQAASAAEAAEARRKNVGQSPLRTQTNKLETTHPKTSRE